MNHFSDFDVFDIENPYPLGVPTRVVKEFEDTLAEMAAERPAFNIDCRGMEGTDWSKANHRVQDWLVGQGVDVGLRRYIINTVFGLLIPVGHDRDKLVGVRVAWEPGLGWHVLAMRAHEGCTCAAPNQ